MLLLNITVLGVNQFFQVSYYCCFLMESTSSQSQFCAGVCACIGGEVTWVETDGFVGGVSSKSTLTACYVSFESSVVCISSSSHGGCHWKLKGNCIDRAGSVVHICFVTGCLKSFSSHTFSLPSLFSNMHIHLDHCLFTLSTLFVFVDY